MRFLLSLLLMCCCAQVLADRTDVVPLRHKIAEDLLPSLRQTFPEAGIQSFNGQLIVRAPDEATFRRIIDLVRQLDTATRRLRITVEQRESRDADNVRIDAQGRVVISEQGADGEAVIAGDARQSRDMAVSRQTLSTLDGSSAAILLGSQRFVPMLSFAHRPGYRIVTVGGAWQSAGTGFQIEPRLIGDQVQLRLSPQSSQFQRDGSVSVKGIYSEVQGRLGEWLPVGESSQETGAGQRGVFSYSESRELKRYTVWVRVEAAE